MAKEKILIVEDEEDILELISYNLAQVGYQVTGVTTGEEGLKSAHIIHPDLILLDLMLPGLDGLEICKILKNDTKTLHIPILILTAKGEDTDIVAGLDVGADDYITKPFSPNVLIARIRAAIRRGALGQSEEPNLINIHNLSIDRERHEVLADGHAVELTHTEFQLLYLLARRPGRVFSRDSIVNNVRGEDVIVTDRSVDVQISGLRKKLGNAGQCIETIRGVGYRLKEY